jgi:hypothetical protein
MGLMHDTAKIEALQALLSIQTAWQKRLSLKIITACRRGFCACFGGSYTGRTIWFRIRLFKRVLNVIFYMGSTL